MNYPEVVIVLKTWQGPTEEKRQERLAVLPKTIAALEKFLIYPNLSWHIADDGSDLAYVEALNSIMGDRPFAFSWSSANGDIGRNLNIALRQAFHRSKYVLNWSDDLVLGAEIDITPYVEMMEAYPSVGFVMTRASHPSLDLTEVERQGRTWHVVSKESKTPFLMVTSLNLMHRRAWQFYGPYPEGMRMDIMQMEMRWRYEYFEDGFEIVIPDELLRVDQFAWGTSSTWAWRRFSDAERASWHRYRSYNARYEDE